MEHVLPFSYITLKQLQPYAYNYNGISYRYDLFIEICPYAYSHTLKYITITTTFFARL